MSSHSDGDDWIAALSSDQSSRGRASRCDVDDWALPYLDKPQPSVKVRGPMPEKIVFA
jgi:hypothetical protein